jgi:hypothetical protein
MKLIGLMPARNEAWCLGLTARVAMMWCDELVILNHASTDATAGIIQELRYEYPGRATEIYKDGEWLEMQHRQSMLVQARRRGATHIAIIDADELLTGDIVGSIRPLVEHMPRGACMQLPGYNLRGGVDKYHANGIWGNRWFSTCFLDDGRLGWSGDRFHSREPGGVNLQPYRPFAQPGPGVMHLWGASEGRLRAKSALYKVTERLRWPGKTVREIDEMYSWAIRGRDARDSPAYWMYRATPAYWWKPYAHLVDQQLHIDANPWQEAEVRRLVAEHGAAAFAGLDLFGVDVQ